MGWAVAWEGHGGTLGTEDQDWVWFLVSRTILEMFYSSPARRHLEKHIWGEQKRMKQVTQALARPLLLCSISLSGPQCSRRASPGSSDPWPSACSCQGGQVQPELWVDSFQKQHALPPPTSLTNVTKHLHAFSSPEPHHSVPILQIGPLQDLAPDDTASLAGT